MKIVVFRMEAVPFNGDTLDALPRYWPDANSSTFRSRRPVGGRRVGSRRFAGVPIPRIVRRALPERNRPGGQNP